MLNTYNLYHRKLKDISILLGFGYLESNFLICLTFSEVIQIKTLGFCATENETKLSCLIFPVTIHIKLSEVKPILNS